MQGKQHKFGRISADSKLSRSLELPEDDLLVAGYDLTCTDFEMALSGARSAFSTSIGAPSIPKVTWDDVGGLASVKSDILDTVQLPLQHPGLFGQGMKKRSGKPIPWIN
jgi:peroxin-6